MDSLKEIVQKAAAGDVAAFGRLISDYQDAVYGVGVAILGNFHDAQDVAQEVFVQAWRELKSLRDPEKFPAWLCRIARNRCLDLLRKRPDKACPQDETRPVLASATDPSPLVDVSERRDAVLNAIGRLSEPLRVPTTLFYVNGYSEKDVSRMIERPLGTVKRRLHEARQRLRKELMNMVESELKDSRPGPELADHVLRRISQVRVRLSRGESHFLMLTDSKGRSFPIMIGVIEARAIRPWLKGSGSPDALDPHTACVRVLSKFGCRMEKVTVSELKAHTFYGVLKVKSPEGTAEVDCRPSDGLNLAVRAHAPIFADDSVVEQSMTRGKDGKPMPPEKVWRMRVVDSVPFGSLSEILKALEQDPQDKPARTALARGRPETRPRLKQGQKGGRPPWGPGIIRVWVRDPGWTKGLTAWTRKCEGTKLEGVAAGLMGAYCLLPDELNLREAIPLLEKARRLSPEDKRVAFDLSSAYAMSRRAEDALSLLPKEEYPTARACGNFEKLWLDARFRAAVGEPDEACRGTFASAQLHWSALGRKPVKRPAKHPRVGPSKVQVYRLKKLGQSCVRKAEQLCGRGPLVRVVMAASRYREEASSQHLVLGTAQNRAAVLELPMMDFANIDRPLRGFSTPRPLTNDTFCNILRAASIRIESAILTRRSRGRIEAALMADRDGRHEAIALDGAAALSIAFTAKRPVLIAERLAERFYLRGRSGEPLSTKAVIGRVCGQ